MGSRTFKAPSNQTDSIMMVKKKSQSDSWLVCMSEEEAGAEEGEEEINVNGGREETSRQKEPHLQDAGSGKQERAKHISEGLSMQTARAEHLPQVGKGTKGPFTPSDLNSITII